MEDMDQKQTTDLIVKAPSGARFFRSDLHIHSYSGSHDVRDDKMTPQAIVETAIAEELSIIAITDHNDINNVKLALKASRGKTVYVVPGVELSTSDGHLLVYFADLAPLTDYFGKLEFADRGTERSRCTTSLLECLNRIDTKRGFAVLAHVDGDGGFEERVPGNPPHKGDVITHPALLGIELHSATSKVSYAEDDENPERGLLGRRRVEKLGLGNKQFLARVLFSDSHTLNGLGKNAQGRRRLTRIKMDAPSFDGLMIAFQDADARIRLEDEIPQATPHIVGIKLEGGFLDGQMIRLSENLTCIIGGRGAGKSTAFESVRFIAPRRTEHALVDSEVWPDSMQIVWADKAGQIHSAHRRKFEDITNIEDPLMGPTTMPLESYGQSETAQTSKNAQTDPGALLDFLDEFIDIEDLQNGDESFCETLLTSQTDIEKAQDQVNRIPETKKRLIDIQQQLRTLEAANAKEVVALERRIAEERGMRETLSQQVKDLTAMFELSDAEEVLAAMGNLATPEHLRVGVSEYQTIVDLISSFQSKFESTRSELIAGVSTLASQVRLQLSQWKAKEQVILLEIDAKRKELQASGIRLDYAYIQKLASDEATYRRNLETLEKWNTHLASLQKARRQLLQDRKTNRAQISNLRAKFAVTANAALRGALSDLSVSIKFVESALSPEAEDIIKDAMNWRTSQVPKASLMVEQVTIPKLLDAIRKSDRKPLLDIKAKDGSKPFSYTSSKEVLDTLGQRRNLFRIQRCKIEDLPRITVSKKQKKPDGSVTHLTKEFSKLSLGQQQSVLLALMLSSDSVSPLMIDQPEDNLDSEFIFHSLVPVLRRAKERRQVVIVTHNANIAVLGDAEKIIALKSTSDKSTIVAQGSIDERETRSVVCQMLEGAEEAFRRRAKIYGLRIE